MATITDMRRIVLPVAVTIAALGLSASASASIKDSPPYQPSWRLVYQTPDSDAGLGLNSVTAPARDDAWAVGSVGRKDPTGYVVRWNGYHWRQVALPAKGFEPFYVESSAPDDVWVFGMDGNSDAVYYWWASSWHAVPAPKPDDLSPAAGLVVTAADVWLPYGGQSLHWNGAQWQAVKLPRGFVAETFADVGGTIWAVGGLGSKSVPTVYRLLGGRWNRLPMPYARGDFDNVVVDGPHSVFVVAAVPDASSIDPPTVLHWNGSSWRRLPASSSTPYSTQPAASYGANGLWQDSNLLWNGRQWVYPDTGPTSAADMATVRGTTSTWLVARACTGFESGCRGEIWQTGPLPH
jgi:hypothetical protein